MTAAQLDEETVADVVAEDEFGNEEGNDNQFVTFAVAGEMFAVPMAPVQEIIRVPSVARLPLAPASLEGLANLRGRVLPIVNLRRLFNTAERESDDATRAVVINLGQPLGFVVDRVASVINVEPAQIESADTIQSIVDASYLTGVIKRKDAEGRDQMLLTLDFDQLIGAQFAQIRKAAGATSVAAAGAVAKAADEGEVESDELRLVSFTVAAQEYAIDIADVQEIVQVPERITALPNTPAHVVGVITLRQRLLPLVSLRAMFSLPPVELGEYHRIVVVALPGGAQVGLVTDAVKEVLSVPREHADAMPGLLAQDQQMQEFASICRLDSGKRLVSIIATDRLLGMRAIKEAVMAAADAGASLAGDEATDEEREDMAVDDDDAQVVIFRLGAEEFGVPIMTVQEIVRIPEVLTRVPRTPGFVEGVINLRGSVLPVIDQRRRLGLESIERNDGQRIMVYNFDGLRTGFIVDSVAEVLRIPEGHIETAPELSEAQGALITRIAKLDGQKRMVMLIEPRQLLAAREVVAVEAMLDGKAAARDEPVPLPKAA